MNLDLNKDLLMTEPNQFLFKNTKDFLSFGRIIIREIANTTSLDKAGTFLTQDTSHYWWQRGRHQINKFEVLKLFSLTKKEYNKLGAKEFKKS